MMFRSPNVSWDALGGRESAPVITWGQGGMGMIADDTDIPAMLALREHPLIFPNGQGGLLPVDFNLVGIATKTGSRAAKYLRSSHPFGDVLNVTGEDSVAQMVKGVHPTIVKNSLPDHLHFAPTLAAIEGGSNVILEKPAFTSMVECDRVAEAARKEKKLVLVVLHKRYDEAHMNLFRRVSDGEFKRPYLSRAQLFEPLFMAQNQFLPWIAGRNPATYVAIHWFDLIHELATMFKARLITVTAQGTRGQVDRILKDADLFDADGPKTWDSVHVVLTYAYEDGEEFVAEIDTSWVQPNTAPSWVSQRWDIGFGGGAWWEGDSCRRGVTLSNDGIDETRPFDNPYFTKKRRWPDGTNFHAGYGIDALVDNVIKVGRLEHEGPAEERDDRFSELINGADGWNFIGHPGQRAGVAFVQAVEELLRLQGEGKPNCVAQINDRKGRGGIVIEAPGETSPIVVYEAAV